jgi:HPr kinase/phosphorylase
VRAQTILVHGTCVAVGPRGLLIRGVSGSGKSSLALQLMALGGELVSDDQVALADHGDEGPLWASAPASIAGLIEARGLGLLRVPFRASAALTDVLDLDLAETDRLPPRRDCNIGGRNLPLLHKIAGGHFPAALMTYLRGERQS